MKLFKMSGFDNAVPVLIASQITAASAAINAVLSIFEKSSIVFVFQREPAIAISCDSSKPAPKDFELKQHKAGSFWEDVNE